MRVVLLTCAVSAIVDEITKNLSVISVVEQLNFIQFPAAVPMTVVASIEREGDDPDIVEVRVRFDLDDETLMDQPAHINFQGQSSTRLIAHIGGLLIPRAGTLTCRLLHKNRKLEAWEIRVPNVEGAMTASSLPPDETQARKSKTTKEISKKIAKVKKAAKARKMAKR